MKPTQIPAEDHQAVRERDGVRSTDPVRRRSAEFRRVAAGFSAQEAAERRAVPRA